MPGKVRNMPDWAAKAASRRLQSRGNSAVAHANAPGQQKKSFNTAPGVLKPQNPIARLASATRKVPPPAGGVKYDFNKKAPTAVSEASEGIKNAAARRAKSKA